MGRVGFTDFEIRDLLRFCYLILKHQHADSLQKTDLFLLSYNSAQTRTLPANSFYKILSSIYCLAIQEKKEKGKS